MRPMPLAVGTVVIVDDDEGVRTALGRLFRSLDIKVQSFGSATGFLTASLPLPPCCIVLDVRLPDGSGLELQAQLRQSDVHTPIIFVTGHGDIPMAAKAMKAGAFDFFNKPVRSQDLIDAVQR